MSRHEFSHAEMFDKALRLLTENRRAAGASHEQVRLELLTAVELALRAEPPRSVGESGGIASLHPRALHGLAGRFVELIAPFSEGDPAGLLVQILVAFGNAAGRHAYVRIEDDRHYPNLFALIVGRTARARKGTSWRRAKAIFDLADSAWATECIVPGGLSSGEGLIWSVRDADDEAEQAGARDKRALFSEGEFTAVLKVLSRDGNTLAAVLRNAWDTGDLCIKNKNSPCRATGAHVSIIAHVTQAELLRRLDPTELSGGTFNRFLHVAVRRSKYLPRGGAVPAAEFAELANEIRDRLEFAREDRELTFDADAWRLWETAYPLLGADRPGQYGDATARGDAQVRRLSLIFALLDRSTVIGVDHLWAALAVWDYCDCSAALVYGDRQSDPNADRVLAALKAEGDWMTRGALVDKLGRHVFGTVLQQAIDALLAVDLIARQWEEDTGGRPRELLRASKARKVSLLDLCSLSSQRSGAA